jgi:uncharacterized secreted protein with C-terminal beta-propeller domain
MYKYCESEQTLNIANKSKEGINELIKQFQKDDDCKDDFIEIILTFLSNEYKTRKSNEEFLKMKRKAMTLIENIHQNKITEYDKTLMIYISLIISKKMI